MHLTGSRYGTTSWQWQASWRHGSDRCHDVITLTGVMTSWQWQVRVVDASPQLTRSRRDASTPAAGGGSRVHACVRHRRRARTAARSSAVSASDPTWNCRERRFRRRLWDASAAATRLFGLERHDGQRSTTGERSGADIRCAVSMRRDDRRVSGIVAVQHVEVATTSGTEDSSDVVGTVDDWSGTQLERLVDAVVVSRRRLHHLGVDAGRYWSSPSTAALTPSHPHTCTYTHQHFDLAGLINHLSYTAWIALLAAAASALINNAVRSLSRQL